MTQIHISHGLPVHHQSQVATGDGQDAQAIEFFRGVSNSLTLTKGSHREFHSLFLEEYQLREKREAQAAT